MAKDLQPITDKYITYNSKQDPLNCDQRFLVIGSKNTIINNIEKFGSRGGYTLQSSAGTSGLSIPGSVEWTDSTGDYFPMRAYNLVGNTVGVLEFLISGNWETLMESLTSVKLIFDPYWDDTEKIDRMLWCDGSTNQYDWSGATARLASITPTTVNAQGTLTFGQKRFILNGTRAIRIKDDNGVWHRTVYTGGESTMILTGLGTDLTAFPFSGGNLIVQEVITRSNIPDSTFKVDFLKVIQNQVWAGSRTSNKYYFSKNTSVTDYTFSTPRAIGEGGLITVDGPGRAIESLKGDVILFAGTGLIYRSQFNQITVGSTLAETVKVIRLKTTNRQGALHQNLVANIGNGLAWIGYDNVLYELTDATLAYNPDLRPLSDNVKPDFDVTDFTGGHLKLDNNRLYISAPAVSINYIYEYRLTDKLERQWFWQPPQTFPASRWAIIDDVIHAHSSSTNETYKLFVGASDNKKAIHCIAKRARWSGGIRDMLKNGDEFFKEGKITANTQLTCIYDFDKDGGVNEILTTIIDGSNEDILYPNSQDASLGNYPMGDISIAGDVTDSDPIQRFRVTDDLNEQEFFDYGVTYETNDIDYRWEISADGSNAYLSSGKPTAIKNS